MMCQEHLFALTVEDLLQIEIPIRAKYIRMLFSELTRIMNHLLAITTHALDVGALTPLLWAFEEREKLMDFTKEFQVPECMLIILELVYFIRFTIRTLARYLYFCRTI